MSPFWKPIDKDARQPKFQVTKITESGQHAVEQYLKKLTFFQQVNGMSNTSGYVQGWGKLLTQPPAYQATWQPPTGAGSI